MCVQDFDHISIHTLLPEPLRRLERRHKLLLGLSPGANSKLTDWIASTLPLRVHDHQQFWRSRAFCELAELVDGRCLGENNQCELWRSVAGYCIPVIPNLWNEWSLQTLNLFDVPQQRLAHGLHSFELLPDTPRPIIQICGTNQWKQQFNPLPLDAGAVCTANCCCCLRHLFLWTLRHGQCAGPCICGCCQTGHHASVAGQNVGSRSAQCVHVWSREALTLHCDMALCY
mmetsp:Transcript_8719/g.15081  ORF Transcript_8719/g.15081 Transcript_8719/m.15081 type:complete len:229 (+) Transcript_8719:1255-1941(+)